MNNELNSALYALAVLLEPSNSSQCSTPANGCHENSDPENSDLRPLTPKTQTSNPENSDLSKFKSVLILSFWGLRSEVWVFVTPQTNEELNNLVQVQLWICTELAQETHLSKPKVILYNKIYPCASNYATKFILAPLLIARLVCLFMRPGDWVPPQNRETWEVWTSENTRDIHP